MPLSEAKKIANRKWDKNNLKIIRAYLTFKEYDEFVTFCKQHGFSQSGFIKEAIKDKMNQYK